MRSTCLQFDPAPDTGRKQAHYTSATIPLLHDSPTASPSTPRSARPSGESPLAGQWRSTRRPRARRMPWSRCLRRSLPATGSTARGEEEPAALAINAQVTSDRHVGLDVAGVTSRDRHQNPFVSARMRPLNTLSAKGFNLTTLYGGRILDLLDHRFGPPFRPGSGGSCSIGTPARTPCEFQRMRATHSLIRKTHSRGGEDGESADFKMKTTGSSENENRK